MMHANTCSIYNDSKAIVPVSFEQGFELDRNKKTNLSKHVRQRGENSLIKRYIEEH